MRSLESHPWKAIGFLKVIACYIQYPAIQKQVDIQVKKKQVHYAINMSKWSCPIIFISTLGDGEGDDGYHVKPKEKKVTLQWTPVLANLKASNMASSFPNDALRQKLFFLL